MYTPKSILVHVDGSMRAARRIQLARHLAELFDAQVRALHCVTTALMRYPYSLDGAAVAVQIMEELDREARERAHAAFLAAGAGSPRLAWAGSVPDPPWGFTREALYADLAILGQPDPNDPVAGELPPDFVPDILIDGGRPVLVLPYAGSFAESRESMGRTVLIAWKETAEAARAVSAALPWLQRATAVHAVCYGEETAAPLRSLHDRLSAHGVAVTTHAGGPERGGAGEMLLSLAADLDADLLVMGCYGHSRTREWVLGGATRSVLRSMTLPVLMSH